LAKHENIILICRFINTPRCANCT